MKKGFTLAEVLITLGIIGIVAALTVPGLITKWQDKAFSTQKTVIDAKITEATRQMNLHSDLAPYSDTDGFVTKFKKYLKYANKCDTNSLTRCFAPKIFKSTGEEVDVSSLKNSSNLGKDYSTSNFSFSLIDGTTFLLTYDPDCTAQDPYNSRFSTTQCLGYIVDVNGQKKPNTIGQDIMLVNVSLPGGGCDGVMLEEVNLCVASADIQYTVPGVTLPPSSPGHMEEYQEAMKAYYALNFSSAQTACSGIGMRAPDYRELMLMGNAGSKLGTSSFLSSLSDITGGPTDMGEFDSNWDTIPDGDKPMYTGSLYTQLNGDGTSEKTGSVRCVK